MFAIKFFHIMLCVTLIACVALIVPRDILDQVIEESNLSNIADIMKEWEVSELATALGVTRSDVHRGTTTDAQR